MFSLAGGHWAILQTVAWTGMLWNYTQDSGSIVVGAKKTFSGEYPCDMCRKVAEGKKQEEKVPPTVKVEKKAETYIGFARTIARVPRVQNFQYVIDPDKLLASRSYPPPSPVPIIHA